MNRAEFIKQIMDLYPGTFKKDNIDQYQGWINRYKNAMPESWNFDKLMWYFDTNWNSTVVPPHPSFFRKFREDVKPIKTYSLEEEIQMTEEEKAIAHESFLEFQKKLKELSDNKTL